MSLTEPQKSEIRRHLGYPEPSTGLNQQGGPPYFSTLSLGGAHIGDRYTPAFYDLEYRLIDLSQTAEVEVLGGESSFFPQYLTNASAKIVPAIVGGSVNPGENLTIVVAGQPATYTLQGGDTVATIAAGIARAIAPLSSLVLASSVPTAAVVNALMPGPVANAISVFAYGSPSVTLTVTDASGNPATSLRGGAEPPGPRYVDPATQLMIYGHLPIVRYWETGIPQSARGMNRLKADVFVQDSDEYARRRSAYIVACRDLAQTLAVTYYGGQSYRGAEGMRRTY